MSTTCILVRAAGALPSLSLLSAAALAGVVSWAGCTGDLGSGSSGEAGAGLGGGDADAATDGSGGGYGGAGGATSGSGGAGGGSSSTGEGGGGGSGECDPDAYPLPNAGLEEAPGAGGCPSGMIPVEGFCVDRFEASLVSYPAGEPVSPYFNPGDELVMAVSIEGAVPQGYITQVQAALACEASGKRLCTDAEWLRACRGPDMSIYPYGDDLALGTCNDHREQHPAIEYFMTTDDWIWSELDHPCLNQLEGGLAPAGEFAACVTAEGAFDMVGNLHEWTADPAGTFRGGFYVDTQINGQGCLYATTAHGVSHHDYSTGFRCCADP